MGLLKKRLPQKNSILAKELKIPRQTTYSVIKNLVGRGLIKQSDMFGVRCFYTDLRIILKYLDKEREKLLFIKKSIKGDKSFFISKNKQSVLPKVQFYEGTFGLKLLFEDILDIYKRGKSKIFRGYGINTFSESKQMEDYLKYFIKKRGSLGVKTNLFISKEPDDFNIKDANSAFGRTIKHLNIESQGAGCYLVADKVYIFSYKDNVGVVIENKIISALFKEIFDDHWNRVKD